jgi:hypothetical protein
LAKNAPFLAKNTPFLPKNVSFLAKNAPFLAKANAVIVRPCTGFVQRVVAFSPYGVGMGFAWLFMTNVMFLAVSVTVALPLLPMRYR